MVQPFLNLGLTLWLCSINIALFDWAPCGVQPQLNLLAPYRYDSFPAEGLLPLSDGVSWAGMDDEDLRQVLHRYKLNSKDEEQVVQMVNRLVERRNLIADLVSKCDFPACASGAPVTLLSRLPLLR